MFLSCPWPFGTQRFLISLRVGGALEPCIYSYRQYSCVMANSKDAKRCIGNLNIYSRTVHRVLEEYITC